MNIMFYISGSATRLYKFLNKNFNSPFIKDIKLIVSDMPTPDFQLDLFSKLGIDYKYIDYNCLGDKSATRNLNLSNILLDLNNSLKIDYMISFGGHILAGNLLNEYKWKLINFHPAILPMYPGRKAIDQAVEHGNTMLVGNTAHFIDEGMDTGKIIMQSVLPLKSFKDKGNDYDVILDMQVEMLEKLLIVLNDNRIIIENDEVVIKGADYYTGRIFPSI